MAINPYAPPKGRLTDAVAAAPLWTPSAAGLWCLLLSPIFVAMVLLPIGSGIAIAWLIAWYFAVNRPRIQFVKKRFGSDYERRPWTKIVLVWLADVLVAGFVPGQPASCSSASTEPIRRLG